ncbi:xylan esterase [candidate division KSB1 bacterium]|nr:xylan esterase [candidate division KSB1 bacterium]
MNNVNKQYSLTWRMDMRPLHLPKTFSIIVLLLTAQVLLMRAAMAQDENLNVLDRWIEWSNAENMLPLFLNDQAYQYLDIRESRIVGLQTRADWLKRQARVKEVLMQIVGPFPEKTPLNPRVTGIVQKQGYRIEKILFESMPDYHVSGCLFIPDSIDSPRPAILNVIGHSLESFRRDIYQIPLLNLVKKGFVVFAMDPMGQGERIQYTDEEKKQGGINPSSSTREHSYVTNQLFLTGASSARYWIWDGMRAIDYLLTRPKVDADRIGVTGLSGGGTQTAYLAAFDDRIKAASPAGYICGFRRLLQSIGPQDGEQNFYHGIASGIDHADLIEVFAPKPYLIAATTRDFFSIQGARETYREVQHAYRAFGKPDNLQITEDDYGHGYTQKNREATYAFFQKHLDLPGNVTEENVDILSPEELTVTATGQILTSIGGKTLFDINRQIAEPLIMKLVASRTSPDTHLAHARERATELSGYAVPEKQVETVFRGQYQRDEYVVQMVALHGEGDYVIPLLLMVPDKKGPHPAMLYLDPRGKEAEAMPGGELEKWVKEGFIVVAPDLIGIGETAKEQTYPGQYGYNAVLIGQSIVGIHAGDIQRGVNLLKNRSDVLNGQIHALAHGELCPALLHAAAFENDFQSVTLVDPLISYSELVSHKLYQSSQSFNWGVAGALTAYDLPDLMALVAPAKLSLINARDAMNQQALTELLSRELDFPRGVYAAKNAASDFKVVIAGKTDAETIANMLKN